VQFHWVNQGYADFEGFLRAMNHEKRKKIRQERRKLREAGVRFVHLKGDEVGVNEWAFFYDCYHRTYRQHGGSPYLTRSFFPRIGRTMPNEVLLMIGYAGSEPLCASLHLVGGGRLYGRYWGTQKFVPGLHFEACYYQAIDYCIAHGIATFEGGAQGEHKLARGLEPVATFSNHWLAHPAFAHAVEDFLVRESKGVEAYLDELAERAPFKAPD
jgi:predicted N-acyltransferase